jgi:hypothetical protein
MGRYVIRCSIGTEWHIEKDEEWIPACAAKAPLRNAPRMGRKCSGALKNTSHLGQKDARDKRVGRMAELRQRDGECTTLN